jgi:1-acyl-sn-glycerol-3-phosphate acyltransferase
MAERPLLERVVNGTIKAIVRVMCRVHDEALAQVPAHGPLIVVANHVNFLEAPVLYTYLQPRKLTGFAKAEAWDELVKGFLFTLWGAIPLQRGEADVEAFRAALAALETGTILAVAPEGTRSGDGRLGVAHSGVVLLALRSGVPLLPMVYYGGEQIWHNLARLRRTDFHIKIGRPFYLDPGGERVTRAVRQAMTDEIMYRLAALLPEPYRGLYADMSAASERYLRFTDL